jgi:enoyl-CoA hydratase
LQLNKRLVHRTMEVMGLRTAIRLGTEISALGDHAESLAVFRKSVAENGLSDALSGRDEKFGDYRTSESESESESESQSESESEPESV